MTNKNEESNKPQEYIFGTTNGKITKCTVPEGEVRRKNETLAGFCRRVGTYSTLREA